MRLSRRTLETVGGCNSRMATTAVTRHGFQRGERFEGCEERARERPGGPTDVVTQRKGGPAGNSSNPMTGCRVQQTCRAVRGVNRRSREERQGRKVSDAWQHETEETSFGRGLDRTRSVDVSGGAIFGKPQERMFRREISAQ